MGNPLATSVINFAQLKFKQIVLCRNRATYRIIGEIFEHIKKAVVPGKGYRKRLRDLGVPFGNRKQSVCGFISESQPILSLPRAGKPSLARTFASISAGS